MPHALGEELVRVVIGLRLHVLRQRERDRPGRRGTHQHAHRREGGGDDLLRTRDAVPVARDGLERVIHRHVAAVRHLELLQDRIGNTRGEDVARKQKDREAIHRRKGGAGDHVGRPGTDGARAGEGLKPILHSRVADRGMHHRLLVPRHVVRQQLGTLEERLADPGDVAVTEDAPATREEPLLDPVALHVLRREETNQRLGHGQARHVATRRDRSDSISASVGIASAHASRDATIAPAAFATSSVRARGHPARRP